MWGRSLNRSYRTLFVPMIGCFAMLLATFLSSNGFAASNSWSITRNGDILEIAYGSGTSFPQYAALHLDSSYFRMNYGPESGWGTSVILLPSFWTGGNYYQGAPIEVKYTRRGKNLLLKFNGTISGLDVRGTVYLYPPRENQISAMVSVRVRGNAVLDNRPGEAFKPVMLSSMHIDDDNWDVQSAYIDSQSFQIPSEGWIINPPALSNIFGLEGGTSSWKTNAPTIEIDLDREMQITGWVTSSDDPNDDNVGMWAASDRVLRSWRYTIIAKP